MACQQSSSTWSSPSPTTQRDEHQGGVARRPVLAPNSAADPAAFAIAQPWATNPNLLVAARMAREGSCTVPQMQDVLVKELEHE